MSTCVCGHPPLDHQHNRRGFDCSRCGPSTCARFRSTTSRRVRLRALVLSALDGLLRVGAR